MELTQQQIQAHLAAGLSEDGSPKKLTKEQKIKNEFLAAGLNEDGTIKVPEYEPTEFVIKEMMHQKGCSREDAIQKLKSPK